MVAVTVLTSHDGFNLPPGLEHPFFTDLVAVRMLRMAEAAGAIGVVCAAPDLPMMRMTFQRPFYAVTPGIRPAGPAHGDQKRVVTPAEAALTGTDYVVVGRPIVESPDPAATARAILDEMRAARA